MANARRAKKYDPSINYAYDGSAARVLEREALASPQPQEERRYREERKTRTRPKIRIREAGFVSPFAVFGFAGVAVLAVLILMSYVQLSTISNDVVTLNSEMTRLRSEEAILRARYELAYDLSAIEDSFTTDGSMCRPQSGQVIYVDLAEPDSVVVYENGQQTSGSFIDAVKDLVDSILSYF